MLGATADAVSAALDLLGGIAERDVPLAPFTTYRVGGPAAVLVRPRSIDDLARVAEARAASGLPVLTVGRGSNLLISDAGYPGLAVLSLDLDHEVQIDSSAARVEAGAGALLPVIARQTVREGLTGFEWAVGVPGSLGGAVRMNAGGHGSDIAASLIDVRVADLSASGSDPVVREAAALGLGFRSSNLASTDFVISARLQLVPGDREASERTLHEIVHWRREHQPGGQNAGSVFVNPVPGEVAAGALIDGLGLRGYRHGTASVSEKHANFIQADDGGSADDVYALMQMVRERVLAETGYDLRTEIRLVGFEEAADG
jgi:UDP-N-acetylmuramate dehydrogenase